LATLLYRAKNTVASTQISDDTLPKREKKEVKGIFAIKGTQCRLLALHPPPKETEILLLPLWAGLLLRIL